jgi:anti-sigma regulatory factor (Ser/Thr protein kinase)
MTIPSCGTPSGTGSLFAEPSDSQPHRCYLAMRAQPASVGHARHAVRHTLTVWRLDQITDDTQLVVSELLTNAVQAARTTPAAVQIVALYLALDSGRLFVLVWDACPQLPVHDGHADDDAETGRGLDIVKLVSDRCGTVTPVEGGKVVWAQLNAQTCP